MLTKRQKKKQIKDLKRRLVTNDEMQTDDASYNRVASSTYNYDVDEEMQEFALAEKRARRRRKAILIRAAIIAAGIALIIFLVILISRGITHTSYEVISTEEGQANGYTRSFGGGLLKYSTSGVKYTNDDGELIWDQGYSMENPNLEIASKYALLYDKDGTSIILLNEDGVISSFSSDYPILGAGLSDYGVSAIMTAKDTASEIYFYDNTGGKLDVEIKSVLAESSGYPLSMSLSSDGQGVVLALMFLDGAGMTSRISFINFEEGEGMEDRVVGYFEYDDNVFAEVDYLSNDEVVAFGTDKVCFYSLSNPSSPKVSEEINIEEEIQSVAVGDGAAAIISKATEGGFKLTIYDGDGDVKCAETFAFDYTKFEIVDDYVMVYGGENAIIATNSGNIRFNGQMDGQTTQMLPLSGNKFMQFGNYGTRTIKLD